MVVQLINLFFDKHELFFNRVFKVIEQVEVFFSHHRLLACDGSLVDPDTL